MAKKQAQETQSLTTEQKSEATTIFTEMAEGSERGVPRWMKIRAMAHIAGVIVKELKGELAALNRKVWVDRARVRKGSELTLEEIESVKSTANADFNRGFAHGWKTPEQRRKEKRAVAAPVKTSTETGKESSKPGANGEQGVPHAVALVDMLKRLTVRAKSIQAEMVQFQTSVRVPANGKPLLGDMSEQIVKLVEELNETSAILA